MINHCNPFEQHPTFQSPHIEMQIVGKGGRCSQATEEQLNLPSCHSSWAASRPVQTPRRARRAPASRHSRPWLGRGAPAGLPPRLTPAWQPGHPLLETPRNADNGFVEQFLVPSTLVIRSLSVFTEAAREKRAGASFLQRGEWEAQSHKIRTWA